jgi:ribonuclease HI
MTLKQTVLIYTDGACSGNPGPGGWGAKLQWHNHYKEICGYELETTNNRMEVTAAIEALNILKKPCSVIIYTDSKYLQLGITQWIHKWIKNNWRKADNKPIKNIDLWQNLYNQLEQHEVTWEWVKGHADSEGNIAADRLAVQGKERAINRGKLKT